MTKNGCEFIEFFLHVTDHLIIVRVIIMINHKFFLNIQGLPATLLVKFEMGMQSKISNNTCIDTKEKNFLDLGPIKNYRLVLIRFRGNVSFNHKRVVSVYKNTIVNKAIFDCKTSKG